jgi:hypothetical protein
VDESVILSHVLSWNTKSCSLILMTWMPCILSTDLIFLVIRSFPSVRDARRVRVTEMRMQRDAAATVTLHSAMGAYFHAPAVTHVSDLIMISRLVSFWLAD